MLSRPFCSGRGYEGGGLCGCIGGNESVMRGGLDFHSMNRNAPHWNVSLMCPCVGGDGVH